MRTLTTTIPHVIDETLPLFALLIYAKNEQINLTPAQRDSVAALALSIKRSRRKTAGGRT